MSSISPQQLADVVAEAISAINGAKTGDELKQVRTQFVGDGSPISVINSTLRDVPADEKAEAGKIVATPVVKSTKRSPLAKP